MHFVKSAIITFLLLLNFTIFASIPGEGSKPGENKESESAKVSFVEIQVTDYFSEVLPGARIENTLTGEVFYADFEGKVKIPVRQTNANEIRISHLGFQECKFNVNTQNHENKQIKLMMM